LSDVYRPFGAAITVVALETFDRMRQSTVFKTTLDSLERQISDYLAGDTSSGRDRRHFLAIKGIGIDGEAAKNGLMAQDRDL
jgi:hypothetical protein